MPCYNVEAPGVAMSEGRAFFPKSLKLKRLLSSLEQGPDRSSTSPTAPQQPNSHAGPIRPVGTPLHKCSTSPTSPPPNSRPFSPIHAPRCTAKVRSYSVAAHRQSPGSDTSELMRSRTTIVDTPPPCTPSSRARKDAPRDAPSSPATPAAPLKAGLVQKLHTRRRPENGGANKRNNGPQTSGTYRFLEALSKMRSAEKPQPPACGIHDVLLSRLKGPEPELPGPYTFLQDYAFPGDGAKGLAALKLGESALALHNAVGIYEPLLKRLVGPEPRIPDQYAFLVSYSFPGSNRDGDEQEDNCNGYEDINSIGNSNEEEEEEQEVDNMSKDNDDNDNEDSSNHNHNKDNKCNNDDDNDNNEDDNGSGRSSSNNQFGLGTRQQCQPTGLLDVLRASCQEVVGNDPVVNVAEYGSSEQCADEEPCIILRSSSALPKSQSMKYKLQSLIAESKTKQADCTEPGRTSQSSPVKRHFKGALNAKRSKPRPISPCRTKGSRK